MPTFCLPRTVAKRRFGDILLLHEGCLNAISENVCALSGAFKGRLSAVAKHDKYLAKEEAPRSIHFHYARHLTEQKFLGGEFLRPREMHIHFFRIQEIASLTLFARNGHNG